MTEWDDPFGEWEGEEEEEAAFFQQCAEEEIDWYDVEDGPPGETAGYSLQEPPREGCSCGPCRRQGIRAVDLLVVLLLAILLLEDRYAVRYIASGSMKPALAVGALVVVDREAYQGALPEAGEIAVYRSESGREICHRVVGRSGDGTVFRGDNNDSEDAKPVSPEQLVGRVVFSMNLAAPLIRLLRGLDA